MQKRLKEEQHPKLSISLSRRKSKIIIPANSLRQKTFLNYDMLSCIAHFVGPGFDIPLRFVSKQWYESFANAGVRGSMITHCYFAYVTSASMFLWASSILSMPLNGRIREDVFRSGCLEVIKLYREEIRPSFGWRRKDVVDIALGTDIPSAPWYNTGIYHYTILHGIICFIR